MDAMGGALFLDGEWESLSKMFSTEQDLSFEHLLTQNSDPTKNNLPDDQCLISLLMGEPNSNYFSQTCSSDDSSNGGGNHLMHPNSDDQMSCLSSFDYLVEDSLLMSQLGFPATMDTAAADPRALEKKNSKCEDDQPEVLPAPKKRARVTKQTGKRKKKIEVVEEETGDLSDNDSNASQEVTNETPKEILNMNGKRRASRGAATDPQSLYARKRRERINERLRILQTLVPNGTKVDISTMLEEAVNYVKFLQLQIKLLSSDEMWMYAPLAYNGFDMGFYSRFSPYLPRQ